MRLASCSWFGLLALLVVPLVVSLAACPDGATDAEARSRARALQIGARAGCDGAELLAVPAATAARGPWPVGLRTVRLAGVTADIYYPALLGSDEGEARASFDLRDHLPAAEAARLRDTELAEVPCACVRDLPLDDDHGPYPVVLYFHGRGLTRAEFPTLLAHLASRGFVVVSPDLPGVHLAAYHQRTGFPDREEALAPLLALLDAPAGPLAFLAGRLDARRGLVGHSLGAGVVRDLIDDVGEVAVVMGAGGVRRTSRRVSTLVLGGTSDGFTPFRMQERGYEDSASPRRLVGVRGAGHMHFADHCSVAEEHGGWYGAAAAAGVPFTGFLRVLADKGCSDGDVAAERAHAVILDAITAALEETLTCAPAAGAAFDRLRAHPDVAELREDLE